MAFNDFKKKKRGRSCPPSRNFHLVGIILMAFGATTLCAFLLPMKIWVLLLGLLLLACGFIIFSN